MLSIYVHIPFCSGKCLYCGFYSTPYDNDGADDYLAALSTELARQQLVWAGRRVTSVYVGGGTPTMLTEHQIKRLFQMITDRIPLDGSEEVSVEMNPRTASYSKLSCLKELGVDRISIGVQSFSDRILKELGRPHSAEDAFNAIELVRAAGFRSIGIDLIYGIPGQTEREWLDTVETALSVGPQHLSLYNLSVDEGSRFADLARSGSLALPDEDAAARMYESSRLQVIDAGYEQYELSNFALQSHACRHNLHYWDRGEYVGLGPSAWSFIGDRRWMNISDLSSYVDRLRRGLPVATDAETISAEQADSERMFLGLRRTRGYDLTAHAALYRDRERTAIQQEIDQLFKNGLIELAPGGHRLTARGILLSNEIMERLIP